MAPVIWRAGQMKFDDIIDFRDNDSDEVWYGGVMISNQILKFLELGQIRQ
jgi:hypothetical protein